MAIFYLNIDDDGANYNACGNFDNCIDVPPWFDDQASSFVLVTAAYCILYSGSGCSGTSVYFDTNVADFTYYDFNDMMESYSCYEKLPPPPNKQSSFTTAAQSLSTKTEVAASMSSPVIFSTRSSLSATEPNTSNVAVSSAGSSSSLAPESSKSDILAASDATSTSQFSTSSQSTSTALASVATQGCVIPAQFIIGVLESGNSLQYLSPLMGGSPFVVMEFVTDTDTAAIFNSSNNGAPNDLQLNTVDNYGNPLELFPSVNEWVDDGADDEPLNFATIALNTASYFTSVTATIEANCTINLQVTGTNDTFPYDCTNLGTGSDYLYLFGTNSLGVRIFSFPSLYSRAPIPITFYFKTHSNGIREILNTES
jgi:hypothetical protein